MGSGEGGGRMETSTAVSLCSGVLFLRYSSLRDSMREGFVSVRISKAVLGLE